MSQRISFGARILLAASLTLWLASPVRAQHGGGGHSGGGGGGSHGGGGGGHSAGGGGGHAGSGGGGHVSAGGGVQGGGGGMRAPAPPSGGYAVGGVGSSSFAPPSGSARSGASNSWVSHTSWQDPPRLPATAGSAHPGVPSSAWRAPVANSPGSSLSRAPMTHPMLSPGRTGTAPGSLMTRPFPRRPPGAVVGMGIPIRPSSVPGRFPFRGGCRFDPDCDGDIDFFQPNFFSGGFGFGACPFWSWGCGFGFGWNWGWGWGWMDNFGYPGYVGGYYPPPPPPPTDMSAPEYGPFSYQYPPVGEGGVEATPVVETILALKDGNTYSVTDYWLENGRLHYVTTYGGANDIPVEQLDLQRTVDENAQRGVTFSLRPAPAPQSPQELPPDLAPPATPPSQNSSPPSPASAQQSAAPDSPAPSSPQ